MQKYEEKYKEDKIFSIYHLYYSVQQLLKKGMLKQIETAGKTRETSKKNFFEKMLDR